MARPNKRRAAARSRARSSRCAAWIHNLLNETDLWGMTARAALQTARARAMSLQSNSSKTAYLIHRNT